MIRLKHFFRQHTLLIIYTIVFLILLNGVVKTSGGTFLFEMFLFFIPLVATYFLLKRVMGSSSERLTNLLNSISKKLPQNSHLYLAVLSIILIIGHLIYLNGSPAISAIKETTIEDVIEVRQAISTNSNALWGYASSFNLKGFLPFSILLLFYRKEKLLGTILLLIGSFYAFSLMQKSYILIILMPTLIYAVAKRKYWLFAGNLGLMMVIVVGLVFIANPQFRGYPQPPKESLGVEEEDNRPFIVRVFVGLSNRILVVPGEMVSEWFEHIPEDKPFLNGQGYSFYTKLTGSEHRNYAKELYPIIRPKYAARGLSGSVNAASFAYEYSNFGRPGLVVSGIFLALLFVLIDWLFKENFLIKIALNIFPVFMLSSGALTTLLFSGGWGLLIFLYVLFNKEFSHEQQ